MRTYQVEMSVTKGRLQAILELEVQAPTEKLALLVAGELAIELLGPDVRASANGARLAD